MQYAIQASIGGERWLSGLERRSLNREVLVSNPTDAVSNIGQVRLPHVAYVSRDDSSISGKDGSRSQTKGVFFKRERERERERIVLRSIVNMMIHVQIKITMWIDPRRPALRSWRSLAHRPP